MIQVFDKHRDAASYDDVAEVYARYIDNRLSPPLAGCICDLAGLRPGESVLDIGTGTGVAAREAARRVGASASVMAIDLSPGMIRTAQMAPWEGACPVNFLVMDAEELKFPDSSFDAAISLCAVLHFPAIWKVLREIRRVLVPGGRVVVSFGYTRPIRPLPLARWYFGQLVREGLRRSGLKPLCKAPADLTDLVRSHAVPLGGEGVETEWSRHSPRAALVQEVKRAGFLSVRPHWFGHEVFFSSAQEFLEAQLAIVTQVREALSGLAPEKRDQICAAFLAEADDVLRRRGRLVYPYGVFAVSAVNPGGGKAFDAEAPQ